MHENQNTTLRVPVMIMPCLILSDPSGKNDLALYDLDDISIALCTTKSILINLCREGRFKGRRIGTKYLVTAEEFKKYIETDNFAFTKRTRRRRSLHENMPEVSQTTLEELG